MTISPFLSMYGAAETRLTHLRMLLFETLPPRRRRKLSLADGVSLMSATLVSTTWAPPDFLFQAARTARSAFDSGKSRIAFPKSPSPGKTEMSQYITIPPELTRS